uniref:leucine-rich repeat-containing protein 75B isoform X2 n=1 Tax=Halichoerus grypus TaxID=9711 RepID=UPI001659BEC0|nr:leucine-rich repeat-containing protein 75B isoform X2 [Halichoerus grypus]
MLNWRVSPGDSIPPPPPLPSHHICSKLRSGGTCRHPAMNIEGAVLLTQPPATSPHPFVTDYELWKSSDKICRQLIYHLTPHSKRQQRGSSLPRRKTHSCLKSSLQMTQLAGETVNLSGIPLSARDVRHIMRYLGSQGAGLTVLDLSFTGLSDELLRLMLPSLWTLPRLTQLLLNGNRLTRATARELTEAVKDSAKFPTLAWVDLGNNVDVTSLPQPLLVGLRRRLSQRTSLPTIYEGLDLEPEGGVAGATSAASTWGSAAAGPGSEPQACCTR